MRFLERDHKDLLLIMGDLALKLNVLIQLLKERDLDSNTMGIGEVLVVTSESCFFLRSMNYFSYLLMKMSDILWTILRK